MIIYVLLQMYLYEGRDSKLFALWQFQLTAVDVVYCKFLSRSWDKKTICHPGSVVHRKPFLAQIS